MGFEPVLRSEPGSRGSSRASDSWFAWLQPRLRFPWSASPMARMCLKSQKNRMQAIGPAHQAQHINNLLQPRLPNAEAPAVNTIRFWRLPSPCVYIGQTIAASESE